MLHKKNRRTKPARQWYDYCVPCAKVSYPDHTAADTERKNFVRSQKSDRSVNIYKCPATGGNWHIASSKPKGKQ